RQHGGGHAARDHADAGARGAGFAGGWRGPGRGDPPVSGQRGMTLIGTLVGLLLSVLGVVAMLALYRTMVDVSTSSGQSAVRDSQLASALLGAQMELQAVGWRIEPGEAGDNLRLAGDGRGVVWRFRHVEGGPLLCAGLRI